MNCGAIMLFGMPIPFRQMYRQGDIVRATFPFSDLSNVKIRPVLVLSNNSYNNISEDILVAAVTTNLTDRIHAIPISQNELSEGLLPKKSCIRADKLAALSKKLVIHKIASVKSEILQQCKDEAIHLITGEEKNNK